MKMKKISRYFNGVAILTLNTILIWACLEIVSMAYMRLRSHVTLFDKKQEPPDAREKSSYYAGTNWGHEFWIEYAASRPEQYHAFTVWRRGPYRGKYINIDERGIRFTPGSDCSANSFKVFVFGGSQIWGTGVPDWGTVPAYLETGLQNYKPGPVCVVNFGESGYVSTQNVIQLILQLQSGNIPDIAIFIEGPTDIYSAYQSGRSGLHENFEGIAARVERRDEPKSSLSIRLLESSFLFRVVSEQVAKLQGPQKPSRPRTYVTMNVDANVLADGIIRTYLNNQQVVAALAQQYRFEHHFFWSPHILLGNKRLTGEEDSLKRALDPDLKKLYGLLYGAVQKHDLPGYSLTDVFDDCESLIWIDDAHSTAAGNEKIAQRILRQITAAKNDERVSPVPPRS
jgi:hypothetical protein